MLSAAHRVTMADMNPVDVVARCRNFGWRTVAFVGIAKHAGKTTALNRFLADLSDTGDVPGLCSVGVDGERLDNILGVAKPRIYAPAGTVVASAARALEDSEAQFEWLEETRIASPLGPVMLARVTLPGNVMLAGVRQRSHVEAAVHKLRAYGADWCLVDGAFDRVAAAAPYLVDAVIPVVGAVAGRTVGAVADAARAFLARFQLERVDERDRHMFARAVQEGNVAWRLGDEVAEAPASQAVLGLREAEDWSSDVEAVYVPGAVTDAMLEALLAHPRPITLVMQHPVQLCAHERWWLPFLRAGHALRVWDTLSMAGVAVNPCHIAAHGLPRDELLEAISGLVPTEVPVYDAMTPATTPATTPADGGLGPARAPEDG